MKKRRKALDDLERHYIESSNTIGTRQNKNSHIKRYKEFCQLNNVRTFPLSEFKISKFTTHLSTTMKTVQAIKAYCHTVCEQHEMLGYKPVRLGLCFHKAISGIKKVLHHQVKRAKPLTSELLLQMLPVVNLNNDKEFVVWVAVITGFNLVVRKSNLVPLKCLHDRMHNISRSDVKYDEGIMVIFIRWSKTNQCVESVDKKPLVANALNPICPVGWLLYMMDRIPAKGSHNLFSYNAPQGILPITYHDLMVNMRMWLRKIGENDKAFESHSMRRGATTQGHKAGISDQDLQVMGNWKSQCFRTYIEDDMEQRIRTCFKFNNKFL